MLASHKLQDPASRLATLEAAGQEGVPFTTGILIGIGETRAERLEALLAVKALHQRYGHIQVGGSAAQRSEGVRALRAHTNVRQPASQPARD